MFSGFLTLVVLICALLYFIPSVVGYKRDISQKILLILVNLVIGWTVLGWLFVIAHLGSA